MSADLSSSVPERAVEAGLSGRVASFGAWVLETIDRCGEFALLAVATLRAAARPRFPVLETARQMEAIGARSTTIVLITALFTGMVLALQTGIALARFGAKPYVGSVVGLSLARELGPVLTALMVGGRVGAGITAEIGAMQVTEQVDAIRSMGADPVQKLVLPRVIAATLALPLLTVMANVLGVIGGMLLSWGQFGIDPNFYLQTIFSTVTVSDFLSGIVKTFAFGWIIAMVGCFSAFQTSGGTVGVGRATTRTVVVASIAVLVSDFFLTQLMVIL
jgi:phospholipid/cholesterol/gamma-HCH transport system permease protein